MTLILKPLLLFGYGGIKEKKFRYFFKLLTIFPEGSIVNVW